MGGIQSTTPQNVKELNIAVMRQDVPGLQRLINAGADVNYQWTQGEQPGRSLLSDAVSLNNPEIVKMLVEAGACVNTPDRYGTTPLHIACHHEETEIISILIKAGANVNATELRNLTPLHISISCRNFQNSQNAICMLIEAGANVNIPNECGHIPLHCAAFYGFPDLTDVLVKANSCLDYPDDIKRTPLHRAAEGIKQRGVKKNEHFIHSLQVIKILVLAGCDTLNLAAFISGMNMKTILNETDKELSNWLREARPESLKHLCRVAIKSNRRLLEIFKLELVRLPLNLRDYVSRDLI